MGVCDSCGKKVNKKRPNTNENEPFDLNRQLMNYKKLRVKIKDFIKRYEKLAEKMINKAKKALKNNDKDLAKQYLIEKRKFLRLVELLKDQLNLIEQIISYRENVMKEEMFSQIETTVDKSRNESSLEIEEEQQNFSGLGVSYLYLPATHNEEHYDNPVENAVNNEEVKVSVDAT